MIYLLAGYLWLYVHRPFEVWPWIGTYRVERVYMIVTILYWLIGSHKSLVANRLNVAFLVFGGVVLVSNMMSPYGEFLNLTVENWLKVAVFYVLVVTTVREERDLKFLVTAFLVAMGLYMAHSFREYLCGRGVYRMGTWRMVGVDAAYNDPNTFAATVLYSLPMVYPVWYECRKRWEKLAVGGYVVLAGTCILLTGSRGGFVGLLFLISLVVLMSRHRFKIALALVVAAPLVWNMLPEDRQNRYLTLIDPSYGPAGAQASAEGRTQGWHDGVRLWRENPVFGVGPGVFGRATGSDMQSHQLYGQVLGELGTLGAAVFAGVVLAFLGNALALRRAAKEAPDLKGTFPARLGLAVTLAVVLLLFMGFGGHNLYRYTWLWYGAFQVIALYLLRQHAVELADQLEPSAPAALGVSEPALPSVPWTPAPGSPSLQ